MANGRDPSCNVCAFFELRLKVGERSAYVIREEPKRCVCRRFHVFLPFWKTRELLICSEWKDWKTAETMANWARSRREQFKPGILYAYKSSYEPSARPFSQIDELEPAPPGGTEPDSG